MMWKTPSIFNNKAPFQGETVYSWILQCNLILISNNPHKKSKEGKTSSDYLILITSPNTWLWKIELPLQSCVVPVMTSPHHIPAQGQDCGCCSLFASPASSYKITEPHTQSAFSQMQTASFCINLLPCSILQYWVQSQKSSRLPK